MGTSHVLRLLRAGGFVLLGAGILAACDDVSVVPVTVSTVELTPSSETLLAGQSRTYQATPRGPDGEVLSGRFVSWSVADPGVATVTSGGEVQAQAEGTTTIQATIEQVSATADLTVLQGPEIRLDPPSVGFDTRRGTTNVSPEAVAVTNASPNGQVAGLQMFIEYLEGGASGWLSESTLEDVSAPTSVIVRPNAFGLEEGIYTADIELQSSTAVNSPQDIRVTLSVGAALPRIELEETTAELSIPAFTPTPVPYPAIGVTNSGGGTLTGLSASVDFQDDAGWLTATLDNNQAPTQLRLVFSAVLLNAGVYEATVDVRSSGASNSPQRVFVTLTVTP